MEDISVCVWVDVGVGVWTFASLARDWIGLDEWEEEEEEEQEEEDDDEEDEAEKDARQSGY